MHSPTDNVALLVIDVQNDFCAGGALATPGGEEVVAQINALAPRFPVKVFTQDWHPVAHHSFAANHAGAEPFSRVDTPYGPQVLWPTHCVIGSAGAAFHPGLDASAADLILRKGFRPHIDSYSAFYENDRVTPTGLAGYLRERGVDHVRLAGLALDFCVYYSALDAVRCGFQATVLRAHCRAIDLDGSLRAALDDMRAHGIDVRDDAS